MSSLNKPAGSSVHRQIRAVRTDTELAAIRQLFREYQAFLNVDLCFQDFENELATLPGKYAPPGGELLAAMDGDRMLGCIALRPLEGEVCEMKRLYVRPEARGSGLGRELALVIIQTAREQGYARMRLDTLELLHEAMQLYEQLGFRRISPYYNNPLSGVAFLELVLTDS
ncbi:MAG TPA: GNAT family N-acetyltransferase [Thiolinea sp.]|nr:GNAT family N-acetyltransferase [Thiolinea sp.]